MRSPLAPLLALPLLFAAAQAAPVPKERRDSPALYFPTRVGDVRVYQAGGYEFSEVVTGVEERDGAKVVSVSRLYPHGLVTTDAVCVSEKGLFEIRRDGGPQPRDWLLQLPAKPGTGWEAGYELPRDQYKITYTVHGPERVAVPAGTFEALRVEAAFTFNGAAGTPQTYWYAPGLGEVKWVGGTHTRVLKSFTPGKG